MFVPTFPTQSFQTVASRGMARLLVALTLAITSASLFARDAAAGSASGIVTVSVQVVESCRVETSSGLDGYGMDVKMRCNSKSRPSLGLADGSQGVAPVGVTSLAHSQIATTANGKTLSIEF